MNAYNLIHNTSFVPTDITTLDSMNLPDCEVIFYSPPCQAWSSSGNELGFGDPRGILFFDALRVIQNKRPKIAIMENVVNLTKSKFEFEFTTMLQLLEQEGYQNYWVILDSKDFGNPQPRKRIFLISVREDIKMDFTFDSLDNKNIYDNSFIEVEVDNRYYKVIDPDPSLHSPLLGIYNNRTGFTSNKYTCTLDASYGKGIGCRQNRIAIRDSKGIRAITEREAFMIMGFDESDYFKVKHINKTALYKMAGNSIVISVLEELLKCVFGKKGSAKDHELLKAT